MGSQGFHIPTIPGDLRREETIHHIAGALEYLDKVAQDVFSRISKRVSENKSHLQKINDRVNLAAAKVNKLKGSNKATKVFACAKYPSENELQPFERVFSDTNGLQHPKYNHFKVQEKHPVVDERVVGEKLQFYNVHLNTKSKKNTQRDEGLGGLPTDVPSISSLLLFNTTENPYKKYVIIDPLGVVTKTRATIEEEEAGMAEAPSTIVHNEEMFRAAAENFLYMPALGTVPEIVVPDLLPNLPGVADDESFSADQGPSIAPSVMGSLIPDLPEVNLDPGSVPSVPQATPDNLPSIGDPSSSAAAPPPPPPGGSAPPPPPPPPPPPSADAPPPPVAPPPPPEGVVGPPPPGNNDVSAVAAANQSSGRDNLLDAIRKAGGASGAGLKSAKNRKLDKQKKKKEEKEGKSGAAPSGGGGGGDLMGDLFAMISMRRKGISGTKSGGDSKGAAPESSTTNSDPAPSTGAGGAMDRISAMIPPPPKGPSAGSDGSDDNWD